MVKNVGFEVRETEVFFPSLLTFGGALVKLVTFLSLCFIVCKMGLIPTSKACLGN